MSDDLISRQAAIMGLIFSDGTKDLTCGHMAKILYVIQALPSAQPAPCEFCKHNNIADDKACLMCSAQPEKEEE